MWRLFASYHSGEKKKIYFAFTLWAKTDLVEPLTCHFHHWKLYESLYFDRNTPFESFIDYSLFVIFILILFTLYVSVTRQQDAGKFSAKNKKNVAFLRNRPRTWSLWFRKEWPLIKVIIFENLPQITQFNCY